MNKEKYGFVYIWRDKKRKMCYIGCHWGTIEDGYICSSGQMRDAYRRRPNDFRRKILQYVYTNRIDLLEIEHQWLQLIPDEELGKKYYNQCKHKFGHWSAQEYTQSISKKISIATTLAMNDPDMKIKMRAVYDRRIGIPNLKMKGRVVPEDTRQKISKKLTGRPLSEEHKKNIGLGGKGRIGYWKGKQHDSEYKQNMSLSVRRAVQEGRLNTPEQIKQKAEYYDLHPEKRQFLSKLTSSWKWYNNGITNKRCVECPSGFKPGRIKWAQLA